MPEPEPLPDAEPEPEPEAAAARIDAVFASAVLTFARSTFASFANVLWDTFRACAASGRA